MNSITRSIAALAAVGITSMALVACTKTDTAQTAPSEADDTQIETTTVVQTDPAAIEQLDGEFSADTQASSIEWAAEKKVIDSKHNGTVDLKSGTIVMDNGTFVSGSFVADMPTLISLDSGPDGGPVDKHIKSDDFFGVETYPEATLNITSVEQASDFTYNATGELTIKESTNPVELTITVTEVSEDMFIATAPLVVDRTLYDVRFGSDKFFDNLGDGAIRDEFTLTLTAVMKK